MQRLSQLSSSTDEVGVKALISTSKKRGHEKLLMAGAWAMGFFSLQYISSNKPARENGASSEASEDIADYEFHMAAMCPFRNHRCTRRYGSLARIILLQSDVIVF